jgi:hypothetical protein
MAGLFRLARAALRSHCFAQHENPLASRGNDKCQGDICQGGLVMISTGQEQALDSRWFYLVEAAQEE